MPISNIFRKASHYILGGEPEGKQFDDYVDNETLFCKNNVCVHPPTLVRQEYDIVHHPGYLTVNTKIFTDQHNNVKRPTLYLNWIPNSTLRRCPSTVEKTPGVDIRIFNDPDNKFTFSESYKNNEEIQNNRKNYNELSNNAFSDASESASLSSNSDKLSLNSANNTIQPEKCESECNQKENIDSEIQPLLSDEAKVNSVEKCTRSHSMTSVNITIANPTIENVDLTPDGPMCDRFARSLSLSSCDETNPNWMSTPEFLALKHNLTFPESVTASPIVHRKSPPKCRRFSVDLSQMRSLRLFFNDESCTCGQLVVASRESQYKILHFHHGGLDHLAQVLHQWHSLLHNIRLTPGCDEPNLPYRHFMVCRPEVQKSELHPEEGNVMKITTDVFFGSLLNIDGQLEDDLSLRKGVFFGGLEKDLRSFVWPLLLHCFPGNSTYKERETFAEIRRKEYYEYNKKRTKFMSLEEQAAFWKSVQCVVEKDVVRTDRGNPYYAGEDNPNIDTMKNILLNYAIFNPRLGYTQGMSDLLAPVLCEIKDESDAFWCFVGLMQRTIFVCTPTDNDMDINLSYLRELIRVMVPHFYNHLKKHTDALELLFCHRWILLCFKREFTEAVALRMWEACWANYQTDYFHLFLCLAIIAVYADDVIAQDLRTDEMLLYFSSLGNIFKISSKNKL
ncbi:TBC1 domain family member 16 isoform X2 [Arctopsyche grandis]|uniref:TBC1 domain family member 16 isoform X2 n=1 Tax=Arctopsyche grandis TaxID=121162 RepID=UPI00406D82FB